MSKTNNTQSSWPIVLVDSPTFAQQIALFKDLRQIQNPLVRSLQPRICLQCWMVISIEDAPQHKGHNQTSDFAQMEEAHKTSFLGLCKQYDRLTPDCTQVILMKVQPKIKTIVEQVKRMGVGSVKAGTKKKGAIQEVDLTNAISAGSKSRKQSEANHAVGKKRTAPSDP